MQTMTATYSPDDNKLRLYTAQRLDEETYSKVRAAGFIFAPKQALFVAPAWTPQREDLLISLCGEIGDEDTSLVERAEERAERFSDYSERRAGDASRARAAVDAIADGIPFGQPIMIGHHSQRRAEKDAERIENGMRRAVKMWETSKYWVSRASGAIRHAKYKETAPVRARRIKTLEAEKRKQERNIADSEAKLKLWANDCATMKRRDGSETTFLDRALAVANLDYVSRCFPLADYPRPEGASQYEGQISLWSALGGGEKPPIITPEQARDIANSAHTRDLKHARRWASHLENRLAYERAMLGEQGGTVADKNAPRVGGACRCWASPRGGWSYIQKVNKVSVTVLDNWGNGGKNFTRTIPFDKLKGVMSPEEVQEAREAGRLVEFEGLGFSLLTERPAATAESHQATAEDAEFKAMKDQLKTGAAVQVVTAPQLFPTPKDLARKMADAAGSLAGCRVLEPSAGTGNLVKAIHDSATGADNVRIVAVEINQALTTGLETMRDKTTGANERTLEIRRADFLECGPELGQFDRILMNPPFERGADIKHIKHASQFLKPGGVLVAICANGPRQQEELKPLAASWEALPAGSFQSAGTNVNTALLTIRKPKEGRQVEQLRPVVFLEQQALQF